MRLASRIAAEVVLALLLPVAAARASELAWRGTMTLDFVALPSVVFTGMGVATVNSSASGSHLTTVRIAGGISGTQVVPVTDPEVTLTALRATATLGTGTLRPFGTSAPTSQPQLTQRVLPVFGLARLCLAAGCASSLDLPLAEGSRGVGIGGLITVGGGGSLRLSLEAAPWTIRSATVPVTTNGGGTVAVAAAGWLHGPASFTTSTAITGGAFSLVTPLRVTSNLGPPLGAFGRLTLRFVPEPGLLLLIGSGLFGLAILGRTRMRP